MVKQIKEMRKDIDHQNKRFDNLENLFKSEIGKLMSLMQVAM